MNLADALPGKYITPDAGAGIMFHTRRTGMRDCRDGIAYGTCYVIPSLFGRPIKARYFAQVYLTACGDIVVHWNKPAKTAVQRSLVDTAAHMLRKAFDGQFDQETGLKYRLSVACRITLKDGSRAYCRVDTDEAASVTDGLLKERAGAIAAAYDAHGKGVESVEFLALDDYQGYINDLAKTNPEKIHEKQFAPG